MKKVLVTGAGGFIGSHVVEELLKENIEVRALIRPGESLTNLKGMEIEKVEGDILDNSAVLKAMAGIDTVFHLAAIYSIWMRDWSRIYEVNMQGTQNVLWAAMKSNIARVVYTSSIASIGIAVSHEISFHGLALNYDPDLSHFDLITPCGISGVRMTAMARRLGEKIDPARLRRIMARHFADLFRLTFSEWSLEEARRISP